MDIFSRAVMKAHYWGRRHKVSCYTLIELQHKEKKKKKSNRHPKQGGSFCPANSIADTIIKMEKKGDDDVEKWPLLIQKKNNKNSTIE